MTDAPTVDAAIADALDAYAELTELGEDVDDEWTYVNELSTAWRDRLDAVGAARAGDPIPTSIVNAIARAIDEIGAIDDPHRAIDWLSTFPQIVLLALDEPT